MKSSILIVEDDYILGRELLDALHDDYNVIHVTEGKSALDTISEQPFELCLLDYKLEDMTGGDIMKLLIEIQPNCKIIILSGKPHIKNVLEQENILHHATEVIQKPFDPFFLFKTIAELIP